MNEDGDVPPNRLRIVGSVDVQSPIDQRRDQSTGVEEYHFLGDINSYFPLHTYNMGQRSEDRAKTRQHCVAVRNGRTSAVLGREGMTVGTRLFIWACYQFPIQADPVARSTGAPGVLELQAVSFHKVDTARTSGPPTANTPRGSSSKRVLPLGDSATDQSAAQDPFTPTKKSKLKGPRSGSRLQTPAAISNMAPPPPPPAFGTSMVDRGLDKGKGPEIVREQSFDPQIEGSGFNNFGATYGVSPNTTTWNPQIEGSSFNRGNTAPPQHSNRQVVWHIVKITDNSANSTLQH